MKKTIIATAAAFALCATLVGCGSGESAPAESADAPEAQQVEQKEEGEVVLVESGWSAEDGYIMFGIVLENTGSQAAEFPTVQITAKDESGAIISSDDVVLSVIAPGEKVAFGSQAGNGTAPATVEFSVIDADFTDKPLTQPATFSIEGANEQADEYGWVTWVGQIANTSEVDCGMVNVSVILRNGGAIVGGYSGYVDNLKADMTQSFEVDGYSVPEHDSFETYAMAW